MTPILYSFRRCPYAIRARLALDMAGVRCDLREIQLRKKPQAFLDVSASATVPCLVTNTKVIDESLDIMVWALKKNDPEGWLDMPDEGFDLVQDCDGPFKDALDRTKYAIRYPEEDPIAHRETASQFLDKIDAQLSDTLYGHFTLADAAILPFVRQFAFIDKEWFDARAWPNLQNWLETFLASDRFDRVMKKFDPWTIDQPPVRFPV